MFFQGQDFVEDQTGLDERLDDGFFAALDFAGDGDLALPGEEGDAAHLAQVELDGIDRPLQALGDELRDLVFGKFSVGRHVALLSAAFRLSKKIRFAPPPLSVPRLKFMYMGGPGSELDLSTLGTEEAIAAAVQDRLKG